MTQDGWEQAQITSGGQHTSSVFVSYRDAEREGSIVSISVRLEVLNAGQAFMFKNAGSLMYVRSDLTRMQFDCIKHVHRVVRVTHYQNNNLKGASFTAEAPGAPWIPYGAGSTPIGAAPDDPTQDNPAWDSVAATVCARTAPPLIFH
ncbi:MAG TPA: surface-adhesin E family protein [Steroidobacteraceae bacterium]|jgi:hypothetical protein|nr:surface-adhesin E family protein [Steroidobacteraceae bacterium]